MKPKEFKFAKTNIKGKDYVEVSERLRYLSDVQYSKYSIDTNYDYFPNNKMFVVRAVLTIDFDGELRSYTGTAQEVIGEGYINKTSALENCETSAVGRACAMAGIGVIDSIASVDEINKAENRSKKNEGIKEDKLYTELKKIRGVKKDNGAENIDETILELIKSYDKKSFPELTKEQQKQVLAEVKAL